MVLPPLPPTQISVGTQLFSRFTSDNQTVLEGYFASSVQKKAPLVVLCHAWRGRNPFICKKRIFIASWGFHAFALDMYGKGVLGNSKEENARLKSPLLMIGFFLKDGF